MFSYKVKVFCSYYTVNNLNIYIYIYIYIQVIIYIYIIIYNILCWIFLAKQLAFLMHTLIWLHESVFLPTVQFRLYSGHQSVSLQGTLEERC